LVGLGKDITARCSRDENGIYGECVLSFPTAELDDLGYLDGFVGRSGLGDGGYEET
jgi:hypothetical protein